MIKRFIFAVLAVLLVMSASAYGANLPVSYDLRILNRVTPVRNQENFGTCWAFGVLGALESGYLTKLSNNSADVRTAYTRLGGADSADLSELHLAWYLRYDPDKRWRETSIMPRGFTLASLSSANIIPAIAYLARLDGPIPEVQLPYLSSSVLNSIGYGKSVPDEWYDFKQYPSYELFQKVALDSLGRRLLPDLTANPDTSYDITLRVTDVLFGAEVPKWISNKSEKRQLISKDLVK